MITQEQLKEYVHYDPSTGFFVCVKPLPRRDLGSKLGWLDPKGYLRIHTLGEKHYAHRLAWLYETGEWPTDQIDHINGIRSDNRICNLRQVTSGDNSRNSKRRIHNKTGISGVSLLPKSGRFKAFIMFGGEHIYLGCFGCIFEAACARKSAEVRYGFHVNHGRVQ